MSRDEAPRAAANVQELLALWDREFVTRAYWTILGRAPDAAGLAVNLYNLRIGVSKLTILRAMRTSAEGRQIAATVDGLDEAIRGDLQARRALGRRLSHFFLGGRRVDARERAQRALDNQLALGAPNHPEMLSGEDEDQRVDGSRNAAKGSISADDMRDLKRRLARIEAMLSRQESNLRRSGFNAVEPNRTHREIHRQ